MTLKIVVIGGVAGGASAAARARRHFEDANIVLLQSGPDVSFASCGMPYYVGGEITDRQSMSVQTPASLKARLNLDVRVNTRVTKINAESKTVTAVREDGDVNNGGPMEYQESYDELILAVGAAPFKPPIPGIDRPGLFSLRNLQDMDAISEWIDRKAQSGMPMGDMHFVVAGAGFVGLEMVEQLVYRGANVTLVEMLPQILAPLDVEMAVWLQRDLEARGVDVILGDGIKSFEACPNDPESSKLTLQSGRVLPPAQLTILGLGVRPDTKVIGEAGIALGPRGHIQVTEGLETNVPNVWAVGDAVEINNPFIEGEKWAVPLAGPANRQGRMVADNIWNKHNGKPLKAYKGTLGTSVVRSFSLYAACVGMNEKMLKQKEIPYSCVHVHPGSHAGYYPGAKQVHLKLLFDPSGNKIFGAQAIGEDGVEKRIDVIATAILGKLTIDDLADVELCYAPPVGSAKDVVNMAGMAAQNIVEGLVSNVQWDQVEELVKDPNVVFLDVRSPGEISKGKVVENSIDIPVDDLRSRLNEVPKDKHVIVTCASGQRAYYACRILKQSGYAKVDNLSGAFLTYHAILPEAANA